MWTVLSCVLFALIGAGIAAYLSRGRHPAAVIVGLIVGAIFGLAPLALARQMVADADNIPGLFEQIGLLIKALRDGDPVFWTITCIFLLAALVILGVWAKTASEFRREEERHRRRGRGEADARGRPSLGVGASYAPIAISEKVVVVEMARLRWLLWTSIALAVAAIALESWHCN